MKMILDSRTSVDASIITLKKATAWAQKNPAIAACAVATAGGIAMVAAPGAVSTTILNVAGFTGAGVQSGSLAAAAQSAIGNVAAGSTFAALQSAGAGGAALATLNGVVQGVGATVLGSAACIKTSFLKTKK